MRYSEVEITLRVFLYHAYCSLNGIGEAPLVIKAAMVIGKVCSVCCRVFASIEEESK